MKKVFILFTVIAVILSMGITVFANGSGSFVVSPSVNGAPVLVEEGSSEDIKIVAYRDRHDELSSDHIDHFEDAYASIASMDKLVESLPELAEIAENVNVDANDLAVSDLFFITLKDGADSSADVDHDVKFQAKTLGNFVCLLHFYDGLWHIVPNTVLSDSDMLEFKADELGPYVIVVSTGDAPEYPAVPGGNDGISPWVIVGISAAAVAVGAGTFIIIVIIKKKKRKEDKE